jgi:putative PIN family toxin of toxin-antitoxin system
MKKLRAVIDTSNIVSSILFPASIPRRATEFAVDSGSVLYSGEIMIEFNEVLSRPQFDRYVSVVERVRYLKKLASVGELIEITHTVRACRDPKDDKFLELALSGNATVIITGDTDLLALHPFSGIPILTPKGFLESWTTTDEATGP